MFHLLVPGGRWLPDIEAELVGQFLQFAFPQAHPRAVAAAAIGGDQRSGGVGVTRPTDDLPPLADAVHREGARVVVNANTHPSRVRGQVIDPVRYRAAELLDQEVMDPDFFRVALGTIFAPVVAEIADSSFFLVSTEITGCCSAKAAVTWLLM